MVAGAMRSRLGIELVRAELARRRGDGGKAVGARGRRDANSAQDRLVRSTPRVEGRTRVSGRERPEPAVKTPLVAWPTWGEGFTGAAVGCSDCGLVVRSWVAALAPRYCPRCLARRRVAVEMKPVRSEARWVGGPRTRGRRQRARRSARARAGETRSGGRSPVSTSLVLELPRTSTAPGIARQRMSEWLATEPDRSGFTDAELLVSELVTNAIVHGRGRIELRAHLDRRRLLVRVVDEGTGFVPGVRERKIDGGGGRGLGIVEAAASRWGIRQGAGDAWFELDRPGPRRAGRPRFSA